METITVETNSGRISIEGSETECLLTVGGKPIQFCWFAEIGTTWRYNVGRPLNGSELTEFLSDYSSYQKMTEFGHFEKNQPLSIQFHTLASQLANGAYELSIVEFEVPDIMDAPSKTDDLVNELSDSNFGSYDTYGGLFSIHFTQSNIQESRVAYYQNLINQKIRPLAVVFSLKDSDENFILDGHHKILAYKREAVKARALWIRKVKQKSISTDEGLNLIRRMIGQHDEYERIFRDEKEKGWYRKTVDYFASKLSNDLHPYFTEVSDV